jgi:hypothetical protein
MFIMHPRKQQQLQLNHQFTRNLIQRHFRFRGVQCDSPNKIERDWHGHIFNTILMTSRYSAAWKISKITTIAKTNTSCSSADYRPISANSERCISKVMEWSSVWISSKAQHNNGFIVNHKRPTDSVRKKSCCQYQSYLIFWRHSIVWTIHYCVRNLLTNLPFLIR